MKIKNLTPHTVNLLIGGERVAIEPDGPAPRLSTHEEMISNDLGFDLVRVVYGNIENLPDPEPETMLIVSKMCCDAAPGRTDLVYPTRLVRDDQGRIVGCDALARL